MKRHFVWMLAGLMLIGLLGFSSISPAQEGKWRKKADMPTARSGLSAGVVNGKVYAIGGSIGFFSTIEEYNPLTNTWRKKTDMPTPRWGFATIVVNGKIYVIGGGLLGPGNVMTSIVEEYDLGFAGLGIEVKGKLSTLWGKLKARSDF